MSLGSYWADNNVILEMTVYLIWKLKYFIWKKSETWYTLRLNCKEENTLLVDQVADISWLVFKIQFQIEGVCVVYIGCNFVGMIAPVLEVLQQYSVPMTTHNFGLIWAAQN